MHIKVVQRFPNFFSGFTPETAECTSIEDLTNVPFVKRWMSKPNFEKLRKVIRKRKQHLLVCDLKDCEPGKDTWVIGWLYGDVEQLDLPEK